MKYIINGIIFNKYKQHSETCVFEQAAIDDKTKLAPCGMKAYGKYKKASLCREHFDFVVGKNGIKYLTEIER